MSAGEGEAHLLNSAIRLERHAGLGVALPAGEAVSIAHLRRHLVNFGDGRTPPEREGQQTQGQEAAERGAGDCRPAEAKDRLGVARRCERNLTCVEPTVDVVVHGESPRVRSHSGERFGARQAICGVNGEIFLGSH